jgi:hypothetical protein
MASARRLRDDLPHITREHLTEIMGAARERAPDSASTHVLLGFFDCGLGRGVDGFNRLVDLGSGQRCPFFRLSQ